MSQQDDSFSAKIDDIDLQIIKILNKDGRTPFSQIAKRLGVSTGMIRQRYHRLVQEGVLQVVAVTNPLLMGFTIMAHIGVKAEVSRLKEIADQIAAFEEVIYLVLLTGSYDLHIEVVCRDQAHLLNFLTNKLHSVEGIKDTESFICMQIAKEVYTWTGYLDVEQNLEKFERS
jgi:Lrp/AsnC family transcriptional regulator for asnA, asnC and gidA